MKTTVNRKQLVTVLKALSTLSSKGSDARFTDVIVLIAKDNGLMISAGTGTAFVMVELEAETKVKGLCNVTFKLYELAKAVKDEFISLSFDKQLSVTTDSGLKARLTETTKVIPVDVLAQKLSAGVEAELILNSGEVANLASLSNVFRPNSSIRWMDISSNGADISGSIAGSEYGVLEQLPMVGEGNACSFVLRPDHLEPILAFCGDRVRLSAIKDTNGIYKLTDPENLTWWAAVQRVDRT